MTEEKLKESVRRYNSDHGLLITFSNGEKNITTKTRRIEDREE